MNSKLTTSFRSYSGGLGGKLIVLVLGGIVALLAFLQYKGWISQHLDVMQKHQVSVNGINATSFPSSESYNMVFLTAAAILSIVSIAFAIITLKRRRQNLEEVSNVQR